jgi:hypothetical protein
MFKKWPYFRRYQGFIAFLETAPRENVTLVSCIPEPDLEAILKCHMFIKSEIIFSPKY